MLTRQCLATGLDEDSRKPKNLADQVVRTLDEQSITYPDRLRLIALYLLYKDGLLPADLMKLLAHAQLPPQDGDVLNNLDLLGARVARPLKDKRDPQPPLFPRKPATRIDEGYALSRFTTAVHDLLEEHVRGTLDQNVFPFAKPQEAPEPSAVDNVSSASLRSAKPTWAKSRLSSVEPRQRIIVFMAGGATYSESRACYEMSRQTSREVFLITSHMLAPGLFIRQLGDLGADRRRLGIPADLPKPKAPAHLFEREEAPRPAPPPGAAKPLPRWARWPRRSRRPWRSSSRHTACTTDCRPGSHDAEFGTDARGPAERPWQPPSTGRGQAGQRRKEEEEAPLLLAQVMGQSGTGSVGRYVVRCNKHIT